MAQIIQKLSRDEALQRGFYFPWSSTKGPVPSVMPWMSNNPNERTWVQLFHRMENETATELRQLAKEYGLSYDHAAKTYRRYKRWQKENHVK